MLGGRTSSSNAKKRYRLAERSQHKRHDHCVTAFERIIACRRVSIVAPADLADTLAIVAPVGGSISDPYVETGGMRLLAMGRGDSGATCNPGNSS
jgi:hypothetical protein